MTCNMLAQVHTFCTTLHVCMPSNNATQHGSQAYSSHCNFGCIQSLFILSGAIDEQLQCMRCCSPLLG